MSPVNGSKCPYITEEDGYYFCGDYEHRPQECVNHKFDSRFCPIGLSVLKLTDADAIRNRIDTGYKKIYEIERIVKKG